MLSDLEESNLSDQIYELDCAQLVRIERTKIKYPMSDEVWEELEAAGLRAYAECLKHQHDCFEAYVRSSVSRAMRKRLDELKQPPPEEPVPYREDWDDQVRAALPKLYQVADDEIDRRLIDLRYDNGNANHGKLISVEVLAAEVGLTEEEVLARLTRLRRDFEIVINRDRFKRRLPALKSRHVSSGVFPHPSNEPTPERLWCEQFENASDDTLRRASEEVKDGSVYRRTSPSQN